MENKQENCCTPIGQIKRYVDCKGCDKKPKQETLEQAAERVAYDSTEENKGFPSMKMFVEGATWQKERMYREEEVLGFGKFCVDKIADFLNGKGDQTDGQEYSMEELLEQFKNNS